MCRVDCIAYSRHLPSDVSGPGRSQPLRKEPPDSKWCFGNPVVLLMGCCGGQYPESTAQSTAVRGGTMLHPVPCLAQHNVICTLHPCCPQCEIIFLVASATLHLYFGALGSSLLIYFFLGALRCLYLTEMPSSPAGYGNIQWLGLAFLLMR